MSSKNAPPGAFFFHRHMLTGQASRTDTAAWAALAARYGPMGRSVPDSTAADCPWTDRPP